MPRHACIVGAGYTGLAAALDLSRAGYDVTLLEAEPHVGGLAGTFEVSPGHRVEKFYHHWFTSDVDVLGLIKELGIEQRLKYVSSNTGLYYANSIFRLASPFDLLRFRPLPFVDRVRTGLMALRARRIRDWAPLEKITAEEWILKNGGRAGFELIWRPLLRGQFGDEAPNISAVWFWNKLKLRGSSRDEKGSEKLVYFEGGFGALTDAMRIALDGHGVRIRTGTRALRVITREGRARGVETPAGSLDADVVLVTTPLPEFLRLVPDLPAAYSEPASRIRFLGNVCLVLRLNRSLSSTYWLNVADPSFPFVGVIEHTNFDDPANYGGERIAYVSKYLPTSDPMFRMNDQEVFEYCLPYLKRIFPELSRDWIVGFRAWRAEHSQPVISLNYSRYIPAERTPVSGLWLSTMAQIYPEDRGTNYAVRNGRAVAAKMIAEA